MRAHPRGRSVRSTLAENDRLNRQKPGSSAFVGAGMSPDGDGGMEVEGNLNVHGNANFDGNTTIGGSAAIVGTLSLPAGIIGNEALANPIQVASTVGSATGFSITTTPTKRAQSTLTVPDGFTQALVFCFVNGAGYNPTTTFDFLTVQAAVNGSTGGGVIASTPGEEFSTTVTAVRSSTLSGLTSGQVITAEAWIASQAASWGADGSNMLFINAFAVWLR